jgi:hypothetical protein
VPGPPSVGRAPARSQTARGLRSPSPPRAWPA